MYQDCTVCLTCVGSIVSHQCQDDSLVLMMHHLVVTVHCHQSLVPPQPQLASNLLTGARETCHETRPDQSKMSTASVNQSDVSITWSQTPDTDHWSLSRLALHPCLTTVSPADLSLE